MSARAGEAKVDPDQLRQAIDNLVRNAIEASPSGARVSVRARRAGAAHVVEIEDHGPGIPAEALPRIFDLYFTTKPDGTGVGLAVTHQIVEAHGGSIEVDSEAGRGTRMIVTHPGSGRRHRPVAERVVLVVDDEASQRTVLAGFLRKRGMEVIHRRERG